MPRNATVLLVRHAEETGREEDRGLSAAGLCRAWAYVPYFRSRRGLAPPSILIAAADELDSERPRLALAPLAAVQGQKIEARLGEKRYRALAALLRKRRRFDGAVTLICWRHKQLLPLARVLGADPRSLPGEWPDEYGWLVRLDFDGDGECTTRVASQRLMLADTRTPRALRTTCTPVP